LPLALLFLLAAFGRPKAFKIWLGLYRTAAIAREIITAFNLGRKVLVLNERTEYLDAILLALDSKLPPPFVLHGRMSKKQLATKLVGEGFDHPPLDTFSWVPGNRRQDLLPLCCIFLPT